MKLKLAVFRDIECPGILLVFREEVARSARATEGYVRVSELVEVDFPDLTPDEIKAATAHHRFMKIKRLREERDRLLTAELTS